MAKHPFSSSQFEHLDVAARSSACLSLFGTCFTLISYLAYPPLRKPFNRLAFCIAIANAFGCLAYSWGQKPIHHGRNSPFCQTQGFFIEWFVMADPLLVLVMAFSVWMRIKARRSADEIRAFENYGVASAFIVPFIPALVFLCWRPRGFTVYGPAVLWCWVSNESNILKLAAFYGPIWLMILCSILLFVLSGRRILHIRAKVNDAQIKEEVEQEHGRKSSLPKLRRFSWSKPSTEAGLEPVSNTSSSIPRDSDNLEPHATHHELSHELTLPNRSESARSSAPDFQRPSFDSSIAFAAQAHRHRSTRFEAMHWKYAKFAFLCTLVLFITWIPISVNRIYNNFIRPDNPNFGLYFASALCIPLHGFGNFIIYVNTSWAEVKQWVTSLLPGRSKAHRRSSEAAGDSTSQAA